MVEWLSEWLSEFSAEFSFKSSPQFGSCSATNGIIFSHDSLAVKTAEAAHTTRPLFDDNGQYTLDTGS